MRMELDINNSGIKYKVIELEQRSTEWKDFRKGKIGASQVAAILGVDPHKTTLELWEEIIFDRETEVTSAIQMGTDKEEEVLNYINSKGPIQYIPTVIQSLILNWAIASLDGFCNIPTADDPWLLEIKNTNRKYHEMITLGNIPPHFFVQMQFQMFVSGSSGSILASSFSGIIKIRPVRRDQIFIDSMLPKILAFRKSVFDFRPPAASDRDRIEIIDPEHSIEQQRYIEVDRLIDELSKEKEALRQKLLSSSSHAKFTIGRLQISKVIRPGVIDY